jgi:hypothetical protein
VTMVWRCGPSPQTPPELRSGSVIPNWQRGDILIWALQGEIA